MSDEHLTWFSECDLTKADQVGGKCANLGELVKAGIQVPDGFAVNAKGFVDFLDESGLGKQIEEKLGAVEIADVAAVAAVSKEISAMLSEIEMPGHLAEEIVRGYERLSEQAGSDDVPVAVRSSALAEDMEEASFAGQLETFLWIQGGQAVVEHVMKCWAGFFAPEALAYRAKVGLADGEAAMAVAVQRMVPAASSGVMFTVNPLNGDRSKVAIDAAWGLGEAVVSGEVTPDHFLLDKVTMDVVKRAISPKEYELAFDEERGGIEGRKVEEPRASEPSVSDEELLELVKLGKQIEKHYGRPQDIEWAMERRGSESSIHLLQSRAETVWSDKSKALAPSIKAKSATEHVLADMVKRVGADKVISDEDADSKS